MAILDFNRLPPTSPIKVADGVGEWEWRFGLLAEQSMWGGLLNGSLGHTGSEYRVVEPFENHLRAALYRSARHQRTCFCRRVDERLPGIRCGLGMKLGSQRCFELDDTPKACNMLQEAEMTHDLIYGFQDH